MREVLLFFAMFLAVLLVIGLMIGWSKVVERQEERRASVKTTRMSAPLVMSRSEESAPQNVPSSLQTDNRQTDRQAAPPPPSRDIMLDTYKRLRKYGMPREEARTMLKALRLPLDNNLWTDAAPPPPEEPAAITPIAGRPTSAQFADPELAYSPPPR